jgi:hypothetical protein
MGYTTDFNGFLNFSRPLTEQEKNYINSFSDCRRVKRNVNKLMEMYNGEYGYPFVTGNTPEEIYGIDGEYFINDTDWRDIDKDKSIIDYNCPPGQIGFDEQKELGWDTRWKENQRLIKEGKCSPGLWCQWVVTDDGTELEWDGGEKFYNYVEWLKYLINHFFNRWGVKLNGEIEWEGEDSDDRGMIVVKDNVVKTKRGRIVYEDDE